MGVEGGFFDVQRGQYGVVFLRDGRQARDGLCFVQNDLLMLNAPQLVQCPLGRQLGVSCPQFGAHHAVQNQRHEANRCVRPDALGQAVVHRANLNFGLEHPKAPLNVGQRLVALQHLLRRQIGRIGHQQQLAIHQARMRQGFVIDRVAEQFTLEVHPHDAREVSLAHLVVEPGPRPTIRELAAPPALSRVLRIELARPLGRLRLKLLNERIALVAGLTGRLRLMRHHQSQRVPAQLVQDLLLRIGAWRLHRGQQIHELAVAPAGHGQDELQRLAAGQLHGLQVGQVVDGQQASVGHGDDAFNGVALHDLVDDGLERTHLARVALKDLVVQRQTIGRLHHAQHDLPGDQPLFGHAVLAHIAHLLRQPLGANGGHVVEDDGQVLIDQGAKQARDDFVHPRLLRHECIHGAQQMLVLYGFRRQGGHAHVLQPTQHAQLGVGVAQAVEDHDTHQGLDIYGVAGAAKHRAKAVKAQDLPQLGQRPNIAIVARRLEFDCGLRSSRQGAAGHTQQAGDDGLQT